MRLLLRSEEHTSELQSPCNLVCVFCLDRKSTRLNSSHLVISYAVFCLKKKTKILRVVEKYTGVEVSEDILTALGVGRCVYFFFLKNGPPPETTLPPPHAQFLI